MCSGDRKPMPQLFQIESFSTTWNNPDILSLSFSANLRLNLILINHQEE
jgi:hypothetical protein